MTSAFARGASKMPRVKSVHHISALGTSDFAYDYSVRSHTQSCSDHHSDIYFAASVGARQSRFHSYKVIYALKIKLGRILDGYDSLILRNESGQCIEKRCLAASGTAAQENGLLIPDAFAKKSGSIFADKSLTD